MINRQWREKLSEKKTHINHKSTVIRFTTESSPIRENRKKEKKNVIALQNPEEK